MGTDTTFTFGDDDLVEALVIVFVMAAATTGFAFGDFLTILTGDFLDLGEAYKFHIFR